MVGDARTIEQLDATRVLLSKRSTSPIDQQPFSSRLLHSLTPKLAKFSATENLPLFTLNQRIISSLPEPLRMLARIDLGGWGPTRERSVSRPPVQREHGGQEPEIVERCSCADTEGFAV